MAAARFGPRSQCSSGILFRRLFFGVFGNTLIKVYTASSRIGGIFPCPAEDRSATIFAVLFDSLQFIPSDATKSLKRKILQMFLAGNVLTLLRSASIHGKNHSLRRRKNGQLAEIQQVEERALLTVAFQFNYAGTVGSGIGFEAADGQVRRDALELAGHRLGAQFSENATILLNVTSSEDANSTTLASAGSEYADPATNGFNGNEVVRTKILTGTDLNGAAADGTVDVNWGKDWAIRGNSADVTGTEYDFLATIYHELLHATGWVASITVDGKDLNGAAPAGQASPAATTPTFTWTDVPGTGRYVLYVAPAGNQSVPLINMENLHTTSDTSQTPGEYRAWVKAIDATTNSFATAIWSRPFSFTVASVNNSQLSERRILDAVME